MNVLDILQNHLLINALGSWAAAQIIKTIIHAIVYKGLDIKRLLGDGGMPSGHSATVTSLALTAGLEYGFDSGVFALATVFAIVVMHDAMGVRREAGRHAKALNELFVMLNETPPEVTLKEFLGHTPSQVVCGALLGAIVAIIMG